LPQQLIIFGDTKLNKKRLAVGMLGGGGNSEFPILAMEFFGSNLINEMTAIIKVNKIFCYPFLG
jgi:hypothetical protein